MKQILYLISSLLCVVALSVGCDSDKPPESTDRETVEIPVEINLTSNGLDLETRASWTDTLKPNIRPISVDRVNVYVYKRPSDQTYETDREGFVYSNMVKLIAKETGTTGEGQPRFTAKGKVPMESGYQYRMTAVAYSKGQGEDDMFALNQSYFYYAEIELMKDEYKTPELFFGNVVYQEKDTLFDYEQVKDQQSALSGWLYRGVAGIELTLTNVPDNVEQINLLADSIYTRVKARVYDDFHSAYDMHRDGTFQHFVIGSWDRMDRTGEVDTVRIVGPNLLEICTSLSLRITMKNDKPVVCRLRVKKGEEGGEGGKEPTPAPNLRSIPDDGGNGTGIIPDGEENPVDPENPEDPDKKNPFRICFKRNNYYRLKGDYGQLTTMNYVLQVTVNPNWDGDINLPLDKSEAASMP